MHDPSKRDGGEGAAVYSLTTRSATAAAVAAAAMACCFSVGGAAAAGAGAGLARRPLGSGAMVEAEERELATAAVAFIIARPMECGSKWYER